MYAAAGMLAVVIAGLAWWYVRDAHFWTVWKLQVVLLLWVLAGLGVIGAAYWQRKRPLATVLAVGALVVWGALFLSTYPQLEADRFHWPAKASFEQINEARRGWAAILGGVLVLAGLAIAWRRAEAATRDAKAHEEGQITERFTRAIDQLGRLTNENPPTSHVVIRLGGIYALERIARDSKGDQGQVMEVLCAYVRARAPLGGETTETPREDVQAALDVIGRRKVNNDPESLTINISSTWLERAILTGGFFEHAQFEATQLGRANFFAASLINSNFRLAQLEKANFVRADLRDAKFGTEFRKSELADLMRRGLSSPMFLSTRWSKTTVAQANFIGSDLRGADFSAADLHKALFFSAKMQGTDFTRAEHLTRKQILSGSIDGATIFPDGNAGRTSEMVQKWTDDECRAAGLHVPAGDSGDEQP